MSRGNRIIITNGIYHVILKGVSEADIFKNKNDVEKLFSIIRKYQSIYKFTIYAFCIMTNHAHFLIGSNDSDLSDFMHSINQSYAMYYNKNYKRHGHVFGDRFKSFPIMDNSYLLNATNYIHRNPHSIVKYKDKEEEYTYSSLITYINENAGDFNFIPVDTKLVLSLFSDKETNQRQLYYNSFTQDKVFEDVKDLYNYNKDDKEDISYMKLNNTHVCEIAIESIVSYVSNYFKVNIDDVYNKNGKLYLEIKSLLIYLIRSNTHLRCKEIGEKIGFLSQTDISRLCNKGYYLINDAKKYPNILSDFSVAFLDVS